MENLLAQTCRFCERLAQKYPVKLPEGLIIGDDQRQCTGPTPAARKFQFTVYCSGGKW
jgi:hypothetical protein